MIRFLLISILIHLLTSFAYAVGFGLQDVLMSNEVSLSQDSSIHQLSNENDSAENIDEIGFSNQKSFTPLPIVTYDSDIGLGAGLKCFALNLLDSKESFDLILFGSTKGERWVRFVFSIPDFELRQQKKYPLAIDLIIDYDVYLKYHFYGTGSNTSADNKYTYRRSPLDVSLAFTRSFSETFLSQAGLKYNNINNSKIDENNPLLALENSINRGTAYYTSFFVSSRYDTRNSYIKPTKGLILQSDIEWAPNTLLSNVSFIKLSGKFSGFSTLLFPNVVLAWRVLYQTLFSDNPPVQIILPLGGNQSLRGYAHDRFLGTTTTLTNIEFRIPVYWKFGAVLGADLGGISDNHNVIPDKLHWNSVAGLRFDLGTFLVRLDFGFSSESTNFYLNFNHIF